MFLSLVSLCQGQIGHYLLAAHANSHETPIGEIAYLSWSVGEPIVFNTDLSNTITTNPGFGIAQGMQSYPSTPIRIVCPTVTVASVNKVLCGSIASSELSFTISYSPDVNLQPDSIQWYFSESAITDTNQLAKIVGAQLPTFKPLFPGFYAVKLKFQSLSCSPIFSSPIKVDNYSTTVTAPAILSSGNPINTLTASTDTKMGTPSLQWYAYIQNPLNRYLLVAGANNSQLNIRYDTYYMVMATYPNGCRLSNTFAVSGHGISLERRSDVRIEGNTVFLPLDPFSDVSSLDVYPNPANGQFIVRFRSPIENASKLELYTSAGVLLKQIEFNEGNAWDKSAQIRSDDLATGVYILKINEEGKSLMQKVMISK